VQRETDEEAGIAVDIHEPVNTWSYQHDDGAHRIGTTFRCTPASTDVATGDEHTDHRWASPDGVRSLDMYDDLRTTILTVLEEHGDLPKLVRDRIPQRIEDDGGTPVVEQVSDGELQDALADKLVEEAREFREDRDPDELADVLEVLRECLAVEDISWRDLEQLRQAKREERGGFDDGMVLERVEAARSDDTDN
ncbi:MAG: hypothetical protein SVU88_00280, partial [Candidatus Nanohaloarchaea archaeon]|nr:hypothetical protein [Candidatus Nanohaloarchaea archaeon]